MLCSPDPFLSRPHTKEKGLATRDYIFAKAYLTFYLLHTLKPRLLSMVRGLTGFVDKRWDWKPIDLSGDLVLDGYALCHELYGQNDGYGGDYVTFAKRVTRFLRCLKKNGIKPYVVFDGVDIDQRKRETHNKRRKQNAERAFLLFQGQLHTRVDYLPYLGRLAMIEIVANVLGEEQLYVADGDADAYIASIANDRKCPVVSVDSDFYIFPISGGYIPYGRLDWDKTNGVQACVYYYDKFAFQCGLQDPSLLAMIPAILGDSCIQPLGLIEKKTAEETITAVMQYLAQFSTLDSCKRYEPHNNLKIQCNIHAACNVYCCRPHEGTLLKYKGGGCCDQELPIFILSQFRKGKWAKMLMDAICFGEVDHRVAIEDIRRPWCHLIGVPIREVIYGIIRGMHGVTEHHRVQKMADCFQDAFIITKTPFQLWQLSGTVLNPQYPNTVKICGDEIILEAVRCTVEFKKSITKPEFWFFFLVSYFWYWNAKDDFVETSRGLILGFKDEGKKCNLLRAIILYTMRKILSIKYQTSHLPNLPDKPFPEVVHALSQWQSVYHDLLCLNQILLNPLPPMQISQTFNCTTVVKFFVFITEHGDKKLVHEMNLDDNCKKIYDDLFKLIIADPSIGTMGKDI